MKRKISKTIKKATLMSLAFVGSYLVTEKAIAEPSRLESKIKEDFMPLLRRDCTSSKVNENLENKTRCAADIENLLIKKGFKPRVYVGKNTPRLDLLKNPVRTEIENIRPVVYFERMVDPSLPTILFDTHYDGRPINDNPKDPWLTNPFNPEPKKVKVKFGNKEIEDELIYARRADDSLGHLVTIVWAIEEYEKEHGRLPVNVKVMFEGAEEIGSPDMNLFVEKYKGMLEADIVVIADTPTERPGIPVIYTFLRGHIGGEICVRTTEKEGHSGSGSFLPNALGLLSSVMNRITDPITKEVYLASWKKFKKPTQDDIAFVEKLYPDLIRDKILSKYGATSLIGDEFISPAVRTTLYPSWDWQLIPEGKNGKEGVIPSEACIIFEARLVEGQDPEEIFNDLESKLNELPESKYSKITLKRLEGTPIFKTNLNNGYSQPLILSLKTAFGSAEYDEIWNGASEPIASYLLDTLGARVFIIGYGHPDDNAHATNESIPVKYGLEIGVDGNKRIIGNVAKLNRNVIKREREVKNEKLGIKNIRKVQRR